MHKLSTNLNFILNLNSFDMQHIRLPIMQLPLMWTLLKAQLKSHWPCRVLQSYFTWFLISYFTPAEVSLLLNVFYMNTHSSITDLTGKRGFNLLSIDHDLLFLDIGGVFCWMSQH